MTDPTIYHNLRQLLAEMDAVTPWEFGRHLYRYTSCGPWTQFLLADGSVVYYEDDEALKTTWLDLCVGIRIGSIVEGSDVEIDTDPLKFPFTEKDLDETVEYVNDEASAAWEEANGDEES